MQGRIGRGGNGRRLSTPSSRDDDDLAVLDVAHEMRADDVERAGLGGEDVMAVEFAEHQRPDAERIARADQLLVGQRDQRIGAFDLAQRLDEALDDARPAAARHEMQDDFGVGGRLVDRAVAHEFAPQRQAVGEIAVMGDGEAAGVEFGEERLHVAQDRLAGRRIAHMADRGVAGQALDRRRLGEMIADEAEAALGIEAPAVEGDDAGRFLAAMLQRMQAERRDGGGVGMAENAEDAAFLAQPVGVEVEIAAQITGSASMTAPAMSGRAALVSDVRAPRIDGRAFAPERQACAADTELT